MAYQETRSSLRWTVTIHVAVVALSAGPGLAHLTNGGFETGALTGWTPMTESPSGYVRAVTEYASPQYGRRGPVEGEWFALLKSGRANKTFSLSQSFTPVNSRTLQFDYFWDGAVGNPVEATVSILGSSGTIPLLTLSRSSLDTPAPGWMTFRTRIADLHLDPAGTYTLRFELQNLQSGNPRCYLGIDQVQLMPLPAAVLLGALGLGIAGWKLRRLV